MRFLALLPAVLPILFLAGCGAATDSSGSKQVDLRALGGGDTPPMTEIPCAQHSDSRLAAMSDTGIGLTSALGLAAGRYALPAGAAPTQLVVMFHGHGNDSCGWRGHLLDAAAHGAVAVAMDYSGQRQTPWENYGWFAREGAADSIVAARYFMQKYPGITNVIAFGVSMGGSVSGVAMASKDAVRADGSPLWNYWIDIEGVNNLIEEYLIARGVAAAGNGGGAQAQQELEEENGGSFEDKPQAYAEITNTLHASEMALQGVVLVNGLDDGLVPTNQTDEMARALDAAGIPEHVYKVVLNGGAESGTTATAIPLGPIASGAGQTYESPLAGHAWEGSNTALVMKTGLAALYALLEGGTVERGETPVPGN